VITILAPAYKRWRKGLHGGARRILLQEATGAKRSVRGDE